jgi:outer membrane receptor protein involved in Fe transport
VKQNILFYFLFFLCLLVISPGISAQGPGIRGKITDEKTSEPLPFVNIGVKGQAHGTFSDSNGIYHLGLSKGTYTLFFSSVGYERLEREVVLDGKNEVSLDIILTAVSQELNTVVVSGSKYAQKIQESISSIEVLKAKAVEISNIPSVDKAVDKIPGVTIVNYEPQIRGGSGFSSGLGSRVMIMVDEIPLLRGDAGRPNWNLLPIDDIDQIEVVKGASSVVYGSSAINGAINVRTAWPKDNPETKVNAFMGMYSKPSRKYDTPWSGMNPMTFGLTVTHSHVFENYDLSGGITYYNDQGYIGGTPESKVKDPSLYNEGPFDKHLKAYFNTRVRSRKVDGLSYGLNGVFYYSENATTYFWYDADTNIYRSYPGSISKFNEFSFYMDPFIKYFGKKGSTHALKNRVFYTNSNGINDQSGIQVTVYDEYQFTHRFQKAKDMTFVGGVTNIYVYADGQVFSGVLDSVTGRPNGSVASHKSENFAVYAQIEKKFFGKLTAVLGGRYEYYYLAELHEHKPIFRAGLNYQAGKGTFLRFSVGQGYRVPSIGERYITTNSGNFGFYPNPTLQSETSLSYELGGKQLFRIGKLRGMADIAGFYENYDKYVEFNFGFWGHDFQHLGENAGFKFFNTGPAVIYGIDGSLAVDGKVYRNLEMTFMVGYTYSIPKATDPHYAFYTNPSDTTKQLTYITTSSDTTGYILKYRVQSLLKADLQLTWKRFSTGLAGRYYGFMKNIDRAFYEILDDPIFNVNTGIKQYRTDHNKGNFIVDFRVSYALKSFKFSLIVNNLLNTEYSLRPLTMEPVRMSQLQVVFKI